MLKKNLLVLLGVAALVATPEGDRVLGHCAVLTAGATLGAGSPNRKATRSLSVAMTVIRILVLSISVGACTDLSVPILRASYLTFPLWVLAPVFATYPTFAFIRGPLRRYRRRKRGLCVKCGYDLTGNESGVCSECGKTIEP